MATHEDWEQAMKARDRCATYCTMALLAGYRDQAAKHAAEYALAQAEMDRIAAILDQVGG